MASNTDLKGKGKELPELGTATESDERERRAVEEEQDDGDSDLDELDDVLDQFNTPSAALTAATGMGSSARPPAGSVTVDDDEDDVDSGKAKGDGSKDDDGEDDDDGDDEDFEAIFAAELAKEMEKVMGGLKQGGLAKGSGNNTSDLKAGETGRGAGSSSSSSSNNNNNSGGNNGNNTMQTPAFDDDGEEGQETEEERAFRETFEKILAGTTAGGGKLDSNGEPDLDLEELSRLMNGLGSHGLPDASSLLGNDKSKSKGRSGGPNAATAAAAAAQQPQSFQDSIKATMSKLAESEAQHKSRAGGAGSNSDDPLAALMAQMEAMGGPGGFPGLDALGQGGDDDQDLPELLDGLMDQLMSKELLYEPISELKDKYPEYLKSGEAATLSEQDRKRYERQGEIVKKISEIFEDPQYNDSDKEARSKVSKLMQEMQDCGAPPKHLLGELGPAMGLNEDGSPNISPDQCIIA